MTFISTAIYENRIEDKKELEEKLHLQEEGNKNIKFFTKNGEIIANGYKRIVYGDHGPYIEFEKENIVCELINAFQKTPHEYSDLEKTCNYFYLWLCPKNHHEIKVYFQLKEVKFLKNAPKRRDGKKSNYNRKEGYADYKRGLYYIDPYELETQP